MGMRQLLNNNRGQALLFIITLLLLVCVLCSAALSLIHTEKLTSMDTLEGTQAYYVADAALEQVLAILKENTELLAVLATKMNKTYGKAELQSLAGSLSGKNLESIKALLGLYNTPYPKSPDPHILPGTIQSLMLTVTVADATGYQVRIEASGVYKDAKRSLVTNIRINRPLNDYPGLWLQHPPLIDEDATIPTPRIAPFPALELPWYASNCDFYYQGNENLRAEDLASGIHFIAGNVTINGYYQGNITLVATGTIYVPQGAVIRAKNQGQDSLLLISGENIELDEQACLEALVYSQKALEIKQEALLTGAVLAENLACQSAHIIEDNTLNSSHPAWLTSQITILSWQEKYPVLPVN